jgi:predicted tellurium resistance membrane protein TerC
MEYLVALVALTAMEIVLGIDNIVFIAILTGKLPPHQQPRARKLGLGLALVMRILLLCSIAAVVRMVDPIIHLSSFGLAENWLHEHEHINEISIKDLILVGGGLFLIWKSVHEIHRNLAGNEEQQTVKQAVTFKAVLVQIAVMDLIFSLDSVITAVGMVKADGYGIWVMIASVMLAITVMLIFAEQVSAFVEQNPTLKMLALSFLILIGVMLFAEGIGTAFSKGYIYFAMAFALSVEVLNLRAKHQSSVEDDAG